MGLINEYLQKQKEFDDWKLSIDHKVADLIREKTTDRKVLIGNIVFSTLGNMVTYHYLTDESKSFYPVWDRDEGHTFGWADFMDCCRIYERIIEELEKK